MQIKEKILSILRLNGPSLPVHIAKGTGQSILFASAFLSELFYERKVRISDMKVGSSPLYLLPGQEAQLENFSNYLKGKEREAYLLIKEKGFLKDSEQQPAIRVALREIKDFAIQMKKEEEIYWRYFLVSEEELNSRKETKQTEEEKTEEQTEEPEVIEINISEEKGLQKAEKHEKKKIAKKKVNKKQDEKFFNRIKEFLSEKNIDIVDIQSFNKDDLVLKIKENKEERLLIAYNKKRITSADLLKAHKKSLEEGLSYDILSIGEISKELKDLIPAIKNLSQIEKIK